MVNYCKVEQVKSPTRSIKIADLGFDTDADYTRYLTYLIRRTSRVIDSYCERPNDFFNGGIELIEHHNGVGSSPPSGMFEFAEEVTSWQERAAIIFTSQRPIISVTQIEENKASIGETDDWQFITAFRWFKHGEIVFASSAIPAKGVKNIRITYKVGYSTTPEDIELACISLCVNIIHKRLADKTAGFISFDRPTALNFSSPKILTPDIQEILNKHKMSSFGEM